MVPVNTRRYVMETTVKVKRKVINGYHPVNCATIVVGKLLSQDEHKIGIGKLTQDFLPVKDEISKTVRKYWHDSYVFEAFKSIKGEEQYFCFSCSIESSLNERKNLDSAIVNIVSELQNT